MTFGDPEPCKNPKFYILHCLSYLRSGGTYRLEIRWPGWT